MSKANLISDLEDIVLISVQIDIFIEFITDLLATYYNLIFPNQIQTCYRSDQNIAPDSAIGIHTWSKF